MMSLGLWIKLKVGQPEKKEGKGGEGSGKRAEEVELTYIQLCNLRGVSGGVLHERENTASSSGGV